MKKVLVITTMVFVLLAQSAFANSAGGSKSVDTMFKKAAETLNYFEFNLDMRKSDIQKMLSDNDDLYISVRLMQSLDRKNEKKILEKFTRILCLSFTESNGGTLPTNIHVAFLSSRGELILLANMKEGSNRFKVINIPAPKKKERKSMWQ